MTVAPLDLAVIALYFAVVSDARWRRVDLVASGVLVLAVLAIWLAFA